MTDNRIYSLALVLNAFVGSCEVISVASSIFCCFLCFFCSLGCCFPPKSCLEPPWRPHAGNCSRNNRNTSAIFEGPAPSRKDWNRESHEGQALAPVTGRGWAKRGVQPPPPGMGRGKPTKAQPPAIKTGRGSPAPSSKERERRGQERRPAAHNKDWERHDHDGSFPSSTVV